MSEQNQNTGSEQKKQLISRRGAIQNSAVGLGALAAAGFASRAAQGAPECVQSPAQTEGPYWVDEMLNRSDIRSDPTTGDVKPGMPLRLAINVSEYSGAGCTPVSGCYVDVWHCDAGGLYSDVSQNGTLGQRFLRGYQVSDAHGNVRFITIYPGYYVGRTVHIHFRVRKFSGSSTTFNFVSQMYFDDTITDGVFNREAPYNTRSARGTRNSNDNIYAESMLLRLADNGDHAVASINVVINDDAGVTVMNGLPMDSDSLHHMQDFGGGTPPFVIA